MVQVIQAGPAGFDMLLYPEQNPLNLQYIQQQFSNFADTLTNTGSAFINGAKALFEEIQNSDMVRKAKTALRLAEVNFHPNMVMPLETLEELQTAQLGMQRWIMAQPDIRNMYHKGLVNGYSDTYVDMHPEQVGIGHYDYRRVMNGILVEDGDDKTDYYFDEFIEDLYEGDRELDFLEQCDVLKTWEVIKMYVEARKDDPTNPFGGEMG